jgi:predicted ribosomally synthesized peptide with nif11-like leader
MSQELNAFFTKVSNDQDLQEQLYLTKEIADVATIARNLGFKITGAEILRAQAGRVLVLPSDELENVAAGKKAKTGAQWGRGGTGYLDNVGFWVHEFIQWGYTDVTFEPQLEAFLSKVKNDRLLQAELLLAKTCKDVARIANNHGYEVSSSNILRHQAMQILKLNDEQAEKVASGAN